MKNAHNKLLVVSAWAAVFDLLKVSYQQRPITKEFRFPVPRSEYKGVPTIFQYTPDFYVQSFGAFLDVRAFPMTQDEIFCAADVADQTGVPLFAFDQIFVPTPVTPFSVRVILGKGLRIYKPRYLCANDSRCWVDTTHAVDDTIHPRLIEALSLGVQLLS